ncbi:hypothetical protein BMW24_014420 [Mycobacterium heckeshornense]|uniref:Uncharacterized protein n=1 Tax=Mycobacterium heckeshornense TaxID=110505 RepID=A0A2G8B7V9_9MYCO|nr:hypothetical protein [Mycobacterium heckeshornense]KMV23963.1 hypothetical protein ACT16_03680 [Mycobacterium heckeshornense]MCV7036594.1 hypothetical protein [Mycobacterium heckeshornense]PIJ33736.1 hypothetical protein BMW24_014420 [Mycobacterium heckeshornense]BCO34462.1 hypothetical protein MHEC_08950 [Mycobacterium heckeshornense]BCQ07600.1 hypothetical protein JMUB5695_01021 [Mycobacterium heckeshornense]
MNRRHPLKALAVAAVPVAAAVVCAPVSHAGMQIGNYQLQIARDFPGHTWLWAVRPCNPPADDCVTIQAIPRPNGQAAPYDGNAHLANGQYTFTVDIPDGVRCVVYFLPSHDTYTWDPATLSGTLVTTYSSSCGGGPGGTETYPFTLVRY